VFVVMFAIPVDGRQGWCGIGLSWGFIRAGGGSGVGLVSAGFVGVLMLCESIF
jgi:hypothetical protein